MCELPVVELAFQTVAGSPWEGSAVLRFNGENSQPFPVREGLTSKQRDDIRWYIEEFMSFPEGGNVSRARRVRITADAPSVDLQDWFVPQLYQAGLNPVLASEPTALACFAHRCDGCLGSVVGWRGVGGSERRVPAERG